MPLIRSASFMLPTSFKQGDSGFDALPPDQILTIAPYVPPLSGKRQEQETA